MMENTDTSYAASEDEQKVDASQLAEKMLKYEKVYQELETIKNEIYFDVMKLKKTQTVGNVRVTYSKGRKSYDYESYVLANDDIDAIAMEEHTTTTEVTKVDYRQIAKDHDPDAEVPFTQSAPSVRIKIEK